MTFFPESPCTSAGVGTVFIELSGIFPRPSCPYSSQPNVKTPTSGVFRGQISTCCSSVIVSLSSFVSCVMSWIHHTTQPHSKHSHPHSTHTPPPNTLTHSRIHTCQHSSVIITTRDVNQFCRFQTFNTFWEKLVVVVTVAQCTVCRERREGGGEKEEGEQKHKHEREYGDF